MSAAALRKHALLALLAHGLLVALWPLVRPFYAPVFRATCQAALAVLDPVPGPVDVRFRAGTDPLLAEDLVAMDTIVTLEHRELRGAGRFGASTFFHGWLPTSVLLALFLGATPLPWRARRWPFVWALVLLFGFVVGRCVVGVFTNHARSSVDGQPLYELSPAGERALQLAWHFAWSEMFANYLVPLAIWALLVFGPSSRRT